MCFFFAIFSMLQMVWWVGLRSPCARDFLHTTYPQYRQYRMSFCIFFGTFPVITRVLENMLPFRWISFLCLRSRRLASAPIRRCLGSQKTLPIPPAKEIGGGFLCPNWHHAIVSSYLHESSWKKLHAVLQKPSFGPPAPSPWAELQVKRLKVLRQWKYCML